MDDYGESDADWMLSTANINSDSEGQASDQIPLSRMIMILFARKHGSIGGRIGSVLHKKRHSAANGTSKGF